MLSLSVFLPGACRQGAFLSEEPDIVGVFDAEVWCPDSQVQALLRIPFVVLGVADIVEVGDLMNESSCLGKETGGGEFPEARADNDRSGWVFFF